MHDDTDGSIYATSDVNSTDEEVDDAKKRMMKLLCKNKAAEPVKVPDSYQQDYYPESCGEDSDQQYTEAEDAQEEVYCDTDDDVYYETDEEAFMDTGVEEYPGRETVKRKLLF